MTIPSIDMLSDTVTLPTARMIAAMAAAAVGDDGYGEDPTVRALEEKSAARLGKEAAAFMPSGTMANLCAILSHAPRGREVIVGDRSDLYNYEAGGVSVVGGIVLHPVATKANGELCLDALRKSFRDPEDFQCAPAGLVALENPHNLCGGRVLALDHIAAVKAMSDRLPVHLDGARIFNAERASGVPVARIARDADSVQFCLSKSLSAPVGSMLCGSRVFIRDAKRYRKMLGGTMRQAGHVAAAGLVGLEEMVERLDEDHAHARLLADGLAGVPGIELDPNSVETNMVFFSLSDGMAPSAFIAALAARGVRMSELEPGRVRAVVHRGIDCAMIEAAVEAVKATVSG